MTCAPLAGPPAEIAPAMRDEGSDQSHEPQLLTPSGGVSVSLQKFLRRQLPCVYAPVFLTVLFLLSFLASLRRTWGHTHEALLAGAAQPALQQQHQRSRRALDHLPYPDLCPHPHPSPHPCPISPPCSQTRPLPRPCSRPLPRFCSRPRNASE